MAFHTCLLVASATSDEELALLRGRVEVLRRYFSAYAPATAHVREVAPARALVGCIALGRAWPHDDLFVWGSTHPLGEREVRAGSAGMRGPGAAAVATAETARFATGATDIVSGYRAGNVASTHAVAAAFLARGEVRLRPEVLADLLAFGHPANDEHMVAGVEALAPGTELVADAHGLRRRAANPAWHLPAEEEAREAAGAALATALKRWHADGPLALGLSAGLDSRVVAVCLREHGLAFDAYTWGTYGSPDVEGAATVAAHLDVAHSVIEPDLLADEQVVAQARRDVVWTEGCAPLGLSAPAPGLPWPVNVTGAGGELGRAFHYALMARNRAEPGTRHLRAAWRPHHNLEASVADSARERARAQGHEAIARAQRTGVIGWRVLDVVYAQQRMRRWTRSRIAATEGAALAPAFLDPDVAAALVALPLEDRLTGGFHRAYLERHAPVLALPAPAGQRRHVPAPARRLAAAWRSRRRAPDGGADAPPPLGVLPSTRRFLIERVPESALVRDGLGPRFADALRRRVADGDPRAVRAAMLLAGPTIAAEVVAGLHDDPQRIASPAPGTNPV